MSITLDSSASNSANSTTTTVTVPLDATQQERSAGSFAANSAAQET